MDMKPIKPEDWSVEYYFTHQYPSMNPYYNSNPLLERELDLLDAIDLVVDTMTEYPDAEKLLEKLL